MRVAGWASSSQPRPIHHNGLLLILLQDYFFNIANENKSPSFSHFLLISHPRLVLCSTSLLNTASLASHSFYIYFYPVFLHKS